MKIISSFGGGVIGGDGVSGGGGGSGPEKQLIAHPALSHPVL